jgi:hypothetical protein
VFTASPGVRASTSADGLVLLDVRGGLLLASNLAGARIWQLLEQHHTPASIVCCIADEFAIDRDQAGRDVDAFVDALIDRRLIFPEVTR